MKVLVLAFVTLGMLAAAGGAARAQSFQNGPYYANPSWDQQMPAAQRFIVLSNWSSAAVLDRETGLVWERSPVSAVVLAGSTPSRGAMVSMLPVGSVGGCRACRS